MQKETNISEAITAPNQSMRIIFSFQASYPRDNITYAGNDDTPDTHLFSPFSYLVEVYEYCNDIYDSMFPPHSLGPG